MNLQLSTAALGEYARNMDHLFNEAELFQIAGLNYHEQLVKRRRSRAAKLGWRRRRQHQ